MTSIKEINDLKAQVTALREALSWCSGSADFGEGGQAREGWLKLCEPLLATPSPAPETEEKPQFNEAGFSEHGCHYGTMYTRVGDEFYDQEDCSKCDEARPTNEPPETGTTGTVCPCIMARMYKSCLSCTNMRPTHSQQCTTSNCVDGRIEKEPTS